MLTWRDSIIADALAYFDASETADGVDALRALEQTTVDDKTLALTDPLLHRSQPAGRSWRRSTRNAVQPPTKWC